MKVGVVPEKSSMTIDIDMIDDETYQLYFDDQTFLFSITELERLHHRLSTILRPETVQEKRSRQMAFLSQLKGAEDAGIQALLRSAVHDDILVLLHSSENDKALKEKLYGNMGEKSVRMYAEDLLFKFPEGVPDYLMDEAMTRLSKTAESLAQDGALKYG